MNTPQQQSPWRSPAVGGIPSTTTFTSQICADCGAPDATWASVNRGVLICEECCSIHRVLGRHVSQVKPVPLGRARPQRRSTTSNASGSPGGSPSAGCWYWPPSLLTMVTTLYSKGANALWEHCLLHPGSASAHTSLNSSSSSPLALATAAAASVAGHKQHSQNQRRKPSPKDPVHPNKSEFIRAKYQLQSFIHRPTKEDSAQSTLEDVSQQLHASVRTGNIEISLRLLCLGADPNYWHPEKGNRPLHVAAKAGQASQVELLIVYGADPGAPDIAGKTPADHARSVPNPVLGDRIAECQYEVTDRLAFFLCSRRPDHAAGQHFLIPEMGDPSSDLSELTKSARRTLHPLSNRLLETVTMDVYDEVDRRETEAVCQGDGTLTPTNRRPSGFLPVNPKLSAMHNQARQKLGTLNSRDLAALIIDLLNEIRRRQGGGDTARVAAVPVGNLRHSALPLPRNMSRGPSTEREIEREPESPVYDVTLEDERGAEDEDYLDFAQTVAVPINTQAMRVVKEPIYAQVQNVRTVRDISQQSVTSEQYMEMKKALEETMAREKDLFRTVDAMKNDLDRLNLQVASLLHDHPRNNQESGNTTMVSEQATTRPVPFPRTLRDDSGLADTSEEVSVNIDRSPDRNPRSEHESVSAYTSQITQSIHELKRAAENEDHGTLSRCAQKIHTLTYNLVNYCLSYTEGERPTCLSDLLANSNRLLTDCLDFVSDTNYFPDTDMEDASIHAENKGSREKMDLKQVLIDDAYNVAMGLKNVLLQFADTSNADTLRKEQCSN